MSKRVKVNVGTLDEMGQRFVNAWHRLGRGENVRERHLTFPDLAGAHPYLEIFAIITPRSITWPRRLLSARSHSQPLEHSLRRVTLAEPSREYASAFVAVSLVGPLCSSH